MELKFEKIYWNNFFDIVWTKKQVEDSHIKLERLRQRMDEFSIDQPMRKEFEITLANMRTKLTSVMRHIKNYKSALTKAESELWKEKKWTYKTITEQRESVNKDIRLDLMEFTEEYEQELNRAECMQDHTFTHIRIWNYFKDAVFWDRASWNRMDWVINTEQY